MKGLIPNGLTALNLVLGMFSILSTFNGQHYFAALFIIAAMIADAADGRAARYFNVSSDFGKELDSLCDLGSFGVAPAVLAYSFLLKDFGLVGYFAAAIFATCGALRLARFNINTGIVKGYFMGLPIPAAGCVLATFVMMDFKPPSLIFPVMVVAFAYLMVSPIHYPDFKGKGDKIFVLPVILTVLIAVYILYMMPNSLPFTIFFSYVLLGIFNSIGLLLSNS